MDLMFATKQDPPQSPIEASIITGFHGEAIARRRSCASVSGSDGVRKKTHGSVGALTSNLSVLESLKTANRENIEYEMLLHIFQ